MRVPTSQASPETIFIPIGARRQRSLGLTDREKSDLIAYLLTL